MLLSYRYLIRRLGLIMVLTAGVAVIVISGCQTATPAGSQNTPTPSRQATATSRPVQTPSAQVSPTAVATPTLENGKLTVTFWTVEPISPQAEGVAGEFMANSLRSFERAHPNLKIDLQLKKASGKGGVVDFLRTAKEVAPAVLPDVVVMNATDLSQAYEDNLIQPLDGRLDRTIVQDLLPGARKVGTVNDTLVGVPLGLELEHVVYNTGIYTTTPMLWTQVLSSNATYLFPAKGINGLVNNATLSQYFAAGGTLLDDQEAPKIDEQALLDVLSFYQQGVENEVISPDNLEFSTVAELWPIYLEGAGLTQTNVRQYLAGRESLNNSTYAAIPVRSKDDIPVTMTRGWVMVLVTADPSRQNEALSLIEWFLSTENNVAWNSLNMTIPTRSSAYQQLAGDDPYWSFLVEQLNTARLLPDFPDYDRIGRIIQQAVQQVLSGEATAEDATATAIDALAP